MGRLSVIAFAGDTVECIALENIFLDSVYSRLLDVVHGMSDMMRRYIQKERMFAPQLPEQADAREIVFHFKIQISPSIKKDHVYLVKPGGSLGLPTRSYLMTLSLMMSWLGSRCLQT